MYKQLCKFCVVLVLFNFALLMTGVGATGYLRFVPTMSYLSNIATFILLLASGYIRKDNLSGIIVLWGLYVVINCLFVPNEAVGRFMTLMQSLYWVSSYFICQYLFTFDILDRKRDRIILIVFYFIAGLSIYSMVTGGGHYNENDVLVASNVVFFPILLLPWIASVRSLKSRWLAVGVLAIITFFSLKRSALIILFIGLVLLLFDRGAPMVKRSSSSKVLIIIIISVVAGFLLYSPASPLNDVKTRFENIESDGGNGRTDLYAVVYSMYSNLPFMNKALGAGYKRVQYELTGGALDSSLSAHNDFLEVLYDYGFVGEVLYIVLLLSLLFRAIKFIRIRAWYGTASLLSFFVILILALFSNLIIYPTYIVFLASFWAFSENRYRLNQ